MRARRIATFVITLLTTTGSLLISPSAWASSNKFFAWTRGPWQGPAAAPSPVPLFVAQDSTQDYEPRSRRIYYPCQGPGYATCHTGRIAGLQAFANANRGHLYVHSDEPDLYGLSAATYAQQYHDFVVAVRAADPTARFSPAGLMQPGTFPPSCVPPPNYVPCPDGTSTTYAQNFLNAYASLYPSEPIVVHEWRFHAFIDPTLPVGAGRNLSEWYVGVDQEAAWSVAHGAAMVLGSFGFQNDSRADAPINADLSSMMSYVESDGRIVAAGYWNYDIGGPHRPLWSSTGLTSQGVVFVQFISTPAGPRGSGGSPLTSFTTLDGTVTQDPHADFGNVSSVDSAIRVHKNKSFNDPATGAFFTSIWASGTAAPGQSSNWRTLAADFTGDGIADFADYQLSGPLAGYFWIHRNLAKDGPTIRGFDINNWAWGTSNVGMDWEVLAADVTGDGYADIIEHQMSTGLLFVRRNKGQNPTQVSSWFEPMGAPLGRAFVGTNWRLVVADFNGDGRADFADVYTPTNDFWVHRNLGGTSPKFSGADWGYGNGYGNEPTWKLLVGDFTGDGYADFADMWLPSGHFWIHPGGPGGTFGGDWGWGQAGLSVTSPWRLLGQWWP